MARPTWTGSISFGLVNVPVKAFTAVRDHAVHFNQLEKKTGARIHHQNVSESSGKAVDRDDIELGYEIRKGRYVTFDRDELDDLRPASTRAIQVSDFVALEEIDPIYYERTYWLAPGGDEAKPAYQLLVEAMEERGLAGIGTVVMRNKQYLTALRPLDGVLAMSTMRFADEVVPRSSIDELPSRRAKVDPKAKKLALQIVDSLSSEWDPAHYHDTYTEQLKEIIARKDKGEEAVVEEAPAQTAQVVDLMAALEASVSSARKGRSRTDVAKRLAKAADDLAVGADDDGGSDDRDARSSSPKKAAGRKSTPRKASAKPTRAKQPASKKARPTKSASTRSSARKSA